MYEDAQCPVHSFTVSSLKLSQLMAASLLVILRLVDIQIDTVHRHSFFPATTTELSVLLCPGSWN